jgi:ankyrin repeat protein
LRKFYQEQPLGYVNFVNSQTCEGYTALMLAVIWNSDRCFSVLVNYGGSDLSIRDSRYADALAHALSYKRTKFADLLSKLRAQKVAVLPVNTAALGQPASLDKLLLQASNKAEGGEGFVAREDTSVTLSPNFSSYDTQRFELMQQMQLWKAQQE